MRLPRRVTLGCAIAARCVGLQLLVNGGPDPGAPGLDGWTITANGGEGWGRGAYEGVEGFTTSYEWCIRNQTVNLTAAGVAAANLTAIAVEQTVSSHGSAYDRYFMRVSADAGALPLALVLEGAKTLLKARLIDLIEFEYHMLGKWSLYAHDVRHLKRMLIWLDLFGYSCFWQGAKAVARASGPWWCNKMEFREHSNLVCSHLPGVLEVLRRLADDGK